MYKATYSYPAGESRYCNHVMALLYEIAEYSLNQDIEVPQEKPVQVFLESGETLGTRRL